MGCGIEPRKIRYRRGPRVFIRSKATCAAPLCEVLTPCRGLRPHHVQKDRIRSWEISGLTGAVWDAQVMAYRRSSSSMELMNRSSRASFDAAYAIECYEPDTRHRRTRS